jgi:tetratricopeptide (TPR) repeat protein
MSSDQLASGYPFDLGRHSRAVSTGSVEAQRWFDLGLNWCFGFNFEEAGACFRKALEADPGCVMAHWGAAYACGPFYNLVWREFGELEAARALTTARDHISQARSLSGHASALENRLVEALALRFQSPHPVPVDAYARWDDEYAAEMRRIYFEHPSDHDVMALFAEALLTRTPRRLWDMKTGQPAPGADTIEAVGVIERSIAMAAAAGQLQHPAIVHLHIHAMEMSNEPERAMASADALATLCPDAGHLNHMPGHIYMLCGLYEKARLVSENAIRADDAYADYAGSMNFYILARCHDIHLMMFTCMFAGQYRGALAAADKMRSILTRDILTVQNRPKIAMFSEGYHAMRMHVLIRFGRWQEIIDEPLPDDPALFLVSMAMHHYARGVAHASLKQIAAAEREQALFYESLGRVPPDRRFLNNPAVVMLGVAESMLAGELAYHKGNHNEAFTHLREAVRRDENLAYTEPWAWMHPPRHALAALLLEQGHLTEAKEVYRDDLGLNSRVQRCTQHPDNVWSLHGLVECLTRRGETLELPGLQAKLAAALENADVPITSSCMCRLQTVVVEASCCSAMQGRMAAAD